MKDAQLEIYSYKQFSWTDTDQLWAVNKSWEPCYWDDVGQYILMDGYNITTGQRLHVIERVIRGHVPIPTYEIKNALVVPVAFFEKKFTKVEQI